MVITYAVRRLTNEVMKPFRHIITIVCIVAAFIANAGEQLTAKDEGAVDQPTAAELQLLQGVWEGVLVGDMAYQKITITITGNSLHFYRDANFWFETTLNLKVFRSGSRTKELVRTLEEPGSLPDAGLPSMKSMGHWLDWDILQFRQIMLNAVDILLNLNQN